MIRLLFKLLIWLGFKKPKFRIGEGIVTLDTTRPYENYFQVVRIVKDMYHYRYHNKNGKYLGEGRSVIYQMDRTHKSVAK